MVAHRINTAEITVSLLRGDNFCWLHLKNHIIKTLNGFGGYVVTAKLFIEAITKFLLGVIFLVYPFIIAVRIKNEEDFLEKELEGYTEYKQKVKYRLIPFVW